MSSQLSVTAFLFKVGISDVSGQLLLWQVSISSTSPDPFLVRTFCCLVQR